MEIMDKLNALFLVKFPTISFLFQRIFIKESCFNIRAQVKRRAIDIDV